jgi:glyoxylase-like metal-dependent hydrolase (beta-lactamase superfamily II)
MPVELNNRHRVETLDLNFQGVPGTIAVYMIRHTHGAVLIECGPGSTVENLVAGLESHGLKPSDISDVLLTHIHLDHGGSAGWWALQGARIHVHPVGAPHLAEPERLLSSARRIYGDMMESLWGEFIPVPEEKLVIQEDNEVLEIEGLRFKALDTPGHAYHHFAYIFQDICFSGDIGAVRVGGVRHLRLPMPPPELNLELWRQSLHKLGLEYENGAFTLIAPTHFGLFDDPGWHLHTLGKLVDEVECWIERVMPTDPTVEELNKEFLEWTEQRSIKDGLSEEDIRAFEEANPSWMSAPGIYRYWHKNRE